MRNDGSLDLGQNDGNQETSGADFLEDGIRGVRQAEKSGWDGGKDAVVCGQDRKRLLGKVFRRGFGHVCIA